MKQISVREFQINPTEALSDLPVALTRYGRVVAIVSSPEKDPKVAEVERKLSALKPHQIIPVAGDPKGFTAGDLPSPGVIEYPAGGPLPKVVPFTFNENWRVWVCPHQNESGQCPLGCIRKI